MSASLNLTRSPVYPGHRRRQRIIRPEARHIIRLLEKVGAVSGDRAEIVFADWLAWLEALLAILPAHLNTVTRTVQSHTAPVQELRSQLRERYRRAGGYIDPSMRVWDHFVEALSVLAAVVRPGLWSFGPQAGPMGPDLLGEVYLAYSDYDPLWPAYDLVSWQEHRLTAGQTLGLVGETEILDRLRAACTHPSNPAGQAALRETPSPDQPQAVAEWLTRRVIPAAMTTYEPFTILDAWAGTGARLLALAAQFPDWAVLRGLVTFTALEPDPLCARICQVNTTLYGLNGYYLLLLMALSPAQSQALAVPADLLTASLFSLTGVPPLPVEEGREATFETLFRRNPTKEEI
ncbi:MAG: hypothetical protein KJ077_50265 [Anaerolineae bacterium]|nr:hypothetical protein [Anaerolineae bacterium]